MGKRKMPKNKAGRWNETETDETFSKHTPEPTPAPSGELYGQLEFEPLRRVFQLTWTEN